MCVKYLKLCHVLCAINLIVYATRHADQLGWNNHAGWLVFALMYACMEVNVTQDQLRMVRLTCATLAVLITGALAIT